MSEEFCEEKTFRQALFARLDSQDKTLGEIKAQVTKTNGRVSDIELWRANVEGKTYAVPIIVSAIIAGLVGFFFK